jgi:cytochrome c oxidase assembly protein subunit 15
MGAVQFNHRVLAITTFTMIAIYWWFAGRAKMPLRVRRGSTALLCAAVLQVTLGIATLLLVVPIVVAASHQAVALVLFTLALYLCHGLRHA